MAYEKLDSEELLRISLDAINQDRHSEAVELLKTLLERDQNNVFGTYLLAAEHAQLGMMDRAQTGFEKTVALAPEFEMARFQLGQLYFVKNDVQAAKDMFAPIAGQADATAISAYARGFVAAANEQLELAIEQFQAGLAMPQDVPALALDVQRVLENLLSLKNNSLGLGSNQSSAPPVAQHFISNYGKNTP